MKAETAIIMSAAVLCLLAAGGAWGKVIYVDDDAPTEGDGTSWTTAYRFLQDALTEAEATGEAVEVRVAQGTYRPDQGAGVEAGNTEATFHLLSGVAIKGGYAGLGQPDPNAWDPVLYETVLHGDLQGNDDFQDTKTLSDNSRHVVMAIGVDEMAVLEGVTIAHGAYLGFVVGDRGAGSESLVGGAGLYNESGAPLIRQCSFSQNYIDLGYGSAVFSHAGAAARYDACTFEDNHGTAVVDIGGHCVLNDCRFVSNHYVGIWQTESTSQISRCLFAGNEATAVVLDAASLALMSGCIFTLNKGAISGGCVECKDCTFECNTSEGTGGAARVDRGTFTDCLFHANSAGTVGAVSAMSLQMDRCILAQNWAEIAGAVRCDEAILNQCLFAGNQGWQGIGALKISGGGVVSNCTFVGNRTASLGVINAWHVQETLILTNCIFRDNTCVDTSWPTIVGDSLMVIRYSDIEDSPGLWLDGAKGVDNIDVDPLFVAAGGWDPNGTPEDPSDDYFVEGDYHLKSQAGRWDPNSSSWVQDDVTSPCIDAGDPNDPIGNESFPNGGRINMGVYGGTSEASKSYFGEPVPETIIAGDINGDGKVDWLDPSILASD